MTSLVVISLGLLATGEQFGIAPLITVTGAVLGVVAFVRRERNAVWLLPYGLVALAVNAAVVFAHLHW